MNSHRRTLEDFISCGLEFLSLEEDWDSYGANKIDPIKVLQALKILTHLQQNYSEFVNIGWLNFCPLPCGGIGISFCYGHFDSDLSIDFNGLSNYYYTSTKEFESEPKPFDESYKDACKIFVDAIVEIRRDDGFKEI